MGDLEGPATSPVENHETVVPTGGGAATANTLAWMVHGVHEHPHNGLLAFAARRHRNKIYDFVVRAYVASGIDRDELARRTRQRPSHITRLLSGPSDWSADTAGELLFAINGHSFEFGSAPMLPSSPKGETTPPEDTMTGASDALSPSTSGISRPSSSPTTRDAE